jgi:hypothetical protein
MRWMQKGSATDLIPYLKMETGKATKRGPEISRREDDK